MVKVTHHVRLYEINTYIVQQSIAELCREVLELRRV